MRSMGIYCLTLASERVEWACAYAQLETLKKQITAQKASRVSAALDFVTLGLLPRGRRALEKRAVQLESGYQKETKKLQSVVMGRGVTLVAGIVLAKLFQRSPSEKMVEVVVERETCQEEPLAKESSQRLMLTVGGIASALLLGVGFGLARRAAKTNAVSFDEKKVGPEADADVEPPTSPSTRCPTPDSAQHSPSPILPSNGQGGESLRSSSRYSSLFGGGIDELVEDVFVGKKKTFRLSASAVREECGPDELSLTWTFRRIEGLEELVCTRVQLTDRSASVQLKEEDPNPGYVSPSGFIMNAFSAYRRKLQSSFEQLSKERSVDEKLQKTVQSDLTEIQQGIKNLQLGTQKDSLGGLIRVFGKTWKTSKDLQKLA